MSSSGPSSRLSAAQLEQRLDDALLASSSHRSVAKLARDLEYLPRERQDLVLHWAEVCTQTNAAIGDLVASLAPRALVLLDAAAFEAWVLAALDRYDRHGARAAMESLRDVAGFRAARDDTRDVALATVEGRLGRFVRGLSGRTLRIRAGAAAWTDTETIHLPARLGVLSDAGANRALYRAMTALLWAQARFGTFNADLEAAVDAWPQRERALAWLAALETVRLEACIARELPGLAREMAGLRGPWPSELTSVVDRLGAPSASVADSLALLSEYMAGEAHPPVLVHAGTLDPAAARRVRAQRIGRETEVLRHALGAWKAAPGRRPAESSSWEATLADDAGPAEFRIEGKLVALPEEARAAAQSLVQDLGEIPPEALAPAGPGAWKPTDRQGEGAHYVATRPPDHYYDEWDFHRNAHRRGWCHLYENDLPAGDAGFVREVSQRHAALIRRIRRRFEALRGEDRVLGRQLDGEELDVDAAVEAVCDRAAGSEPSSRLFARRVRCERSLAALFMVDMSGSTQGWVNDAEREALVMLCEAIETLGDAYAIYGFSGWTRTRCDIYRIKGFGERYGDAVRGRISAIAAKDYTRMGVAIRHLTRLLVAQPARHRLLVSLSDGRPDDFGDEYRGQYGVEDTRRALLEARAQGVRSYCVTIDRHGADYLRHMYGPARYTVLDDVRKLPLKLADIYRRMSS
ncbi:MAG: hypothetical protein HY778_00750 [Betaproteobacteria bacterium]|nr:hypothetical protein [Betaproteobacteria bacterium]